MITGIYKIENIINKKVYIGQSKNIPLRFSNHKYELNKNIHHNPHLQKAWNKYGKENFIFEILCECNSDKLNGKEIYYIILYNSFKRGYNRTTGGTDSETAAEFCRSIDKEKKSTKNKCLECGKETKDGYNKRCPDHKYKCKRCGIRCPNKSNICEKCKKTYGEKDNINPIIQCCSNCGEKIKKGSNKQKYCKKCAKIKSREQHKLLMQKRRVVIKNC